MQVVIDFLSMIGETIVAVVSFVVGLVQDIVFIVQLAGRVLLQIPSYFDWLPIPLLGMIVTGVTILFIYKIAGRG